MRPRPDAAENLRFLSIVPAATPSFNEAAARCRGKRRNAEQALALAQALQ